MKKSKWPLNITILFFFFIFWWETESDPSYNKKIKMAAGHYQVGSFFRLALNATVPYSVVEASNGRPVFFHVYRTRLELAGDCG